MVRAGSVTKPLRAVTLELCQARLDRFDADRTVSFLAERGFDTIVCFALGYARGESYFPSSFAPPHPELAGRDILAEVIAASAARGLRAFAYVNALFGGPEHDPSWRQARLDGTPTVQGEAYAMCPLSGYGDHIVRVAEEIATRYAIDGLYLDEPSFQSWCACPACLHAYPAMPRSTSFGDPAFSAWLAWRSRAIAAFVERVGATVRAARPGTTFFAQHAFPLAATTSGAVWGTGSSRIPAEFSGWYRPSFYAQDAVLVSRSLDLVGIEPWRRIVNAPPWWPGACVSYARSAGRCRHVVPLLEYQHFPWSLNAQSASELAAAAADATANGGSLWYAMYAPDDADRDGWDTLGRTIAELDRAPSSGEPVEHVRVLASRRSAERFGAEAAEARYLDDLIGTIGIVRSLHLPFGVSSAEMLSTRDLEGTAVVLVPSAACLSAAEVAVLTTFVEDGGGLVLLGESATMDEHGRPLGHSLLDDLAGVETRGSDEVGTAYASILEAVGELPAGARLPVQGALPRLRPAGARVLATLRPANDMFSPPAGESDRPVVTAVRRGPGTVVHAGAPWGRLWLRSGVTEAARLVRSLLELAEPRPSPVTVEAPGSVGICAWRAEGELVVWLVNFTDVEQHGEVATVGPVRICIHASEQATGRAGTVRGTTIEPRGESDRLVLELPYLAEWECVRIELAGAPVSP